MKAFGLTEQSNTLVGTPFRRGLSGGQKRRLSVAKQIMTSPKILFLDEPSSGLDSTASFEVIHYLRTLAKKHNIIVICSIHQPSSDLLQLFDKLLLLSGGKTCYFGPTEYTHAYFANLGLNCPVHTNIAEFMVSLVNTDFQHNGTAATNHAQYLQLSWNGSEERADIWRRISNRSNPISYDFCINNNTDSSSKFLRFSIVKTLVYRTFLKGYRDPLPYATRLVIFIFLSGLIATLWLHVEKTQENIRPLINEIYFTSTFLSVMAIAYVPAYIEDYLQFMQEHRMGLYNPSEFLVSNSIVGAFFLFIIVVIFSSIIYWSTGLRSTPSSTFQWLLWLYMDVAAAESTVVLISSLYPNFVVSLTAYAFVAGFWLAVEGFMLSVSYMNSFYKVFYYCNYQGYAFQGLMVSQFADQTFHCGEPCRCLYEPTSPTSCVFSGQKVLKEYSYSSSEFGRNVGIILAIILGLRFLAWVVLRLRL